MFRHYDPELFDWLQRTMREYPDGQTVRIEETNLLRGAAYFAELLGDGHSHRQLWFAGCRRQLAGCDLVFFDPDNGLERSVAFGRRHSHKYLYWTEVRETFVAGASVLVYQHFPREARAAYIARLAGRFRAETGATGIFSVATPHVLFLLAAHERHATHFREVVCKLPLRWPGSQLAAKEE